MKILVAEDDTLSRLMLEKTLEKAGYEIVAVDNGKRALHELEREDSPRLALLDWMMPELDGVEVRRLVRAKKEQPYFYLILLSSKESKQEIVEGLESGADDYLTKPFDVDELKTSRRRENSPTGRSAGESKRKHEVPGHA